MGKNVNGSSHSCHRWMMRRIDVMLLLMLIWSILPCCTATPVTGNTGLAQKGHEQQSYLSVNNGHSTPSKSGIRLQERMAITPKDSTTFENEFIFVNVGELSPSSRENSLGLSYLLSQIKATKKNLIALVSDPKPCLRYIINRLKFNIDVASESGNSPSSSFSPYARFSRMVWPLSSDEKESSSFSWNDLIEEGAADLQREQREAVEEYTREQALQIIPYPGFASSTEPFFKSASSTKMPSRSGRKRRQASGSHLKQEPTIKSMERDSPPSSRPASSTTPVTTSASSSKVVDKMMKLDFAYVKRLSKERYLQEILRVPANDLAGLSKAIKYTRRYHPDMLANYYRSKFKQHPEPELVQQWTEVFQKMNSYNIELLPQVVTTNRAIADAISALHLKYPQIPNILGNQIAADAYLEFLQDMYSQNPDLILPPFQYLDFDTYRRVIFRGMDLDTLENLAVYLNFVQRKWEDIEEKTAAYIARHNHQPSPDLVFYWEQYAHHMEPIVERMLLFEILVPPGKRTDFLDTISRIWPQMSELMWMDENLLPAMYGMFDSSPVIFGIWLVQFRVLVEFVGRWVQGVTALKRKVRHGAKGWYKWFRAFLGLASDRLRRRQW